MSGNHVTFICNKQIENCEDCLDIIEIAKEIVFNNADATTIEKALSKLLIKYALEKGITIENTTLIYARGKNKCGMTN